MAELTSMVEFVLTDKYTATGHKNYATFLKQSLEIWMFIPCKLVDGNWVVLEEPKEKQCEWCLESHNLTCNDCKIELREYQQAKSLCLFEGFEFKEAKEESHFSFIRFPNKKTTPLYPKLWKGMTIEDLIKYKLTLTPAAETFY